MGFALDHLIFTDDDDDEIEVGQVSTRNEQDRCLDASIWSNLPSDMLERVLTHLPVISLVRFRAVCTKFNQVILSNTFLNTRPKSPSSDPWFAVFQTSRSTQFSDQFSAYDPNLNTWHQIPLSFLPCHVHGLASAGGLVCCKGEINGSLSIFVCNPITKQWKMLPLMLKKRLVPVVSMVVQRREFKIIVAGDDLLPDGHRDLSTEIFCSSTNRWTLSGSIPPQSDLELGSAICNGNLYLVTCNPYGALSFNFQEGVWTKIQAPMPRNLIIPSLVECSGRLFMIGGIEKRNMVRSIRVWELSQDAMAWKEVARMKDKLFKEIYTEKRESYFSAVGHGKLICLSIYENSQILALDISTRLWFWLPPYPAKGASDGMHLVGYPFDPNLYTTVD
eukprot:Gb_03842 [translate_table: standard]